MKFLSIIFLFFLPFCVASQTDRDQFYKVLQSDDATAVTTKRKALEALNAGADRNALLGALLMKESGSLSSAKTKLDTFKRGKNLLEHEISTNASSTEYRFLRLIIQENCPKMLGYNKEIKTDAEFVAKHLPSLSSNMQTIVRGYATHSAALKSQGIR